MHYTAIPDPKATLINRWPIRDLPDPTRGLNCQHLCKWYLFLHVCFVRAIAYDSCRTPSIASAAAADYVSRRAQAVELHVCGNSSGHFYPGE